MKKLLILCMLLFAAPCFASMRQLAKGTATTYDIYNGGVLPGAAVRLDGTNEYWAESGVAHWVVVNLQMGGINPITVGATITVSVATGTTDGNAKIMISHVTTGTATATGNMFQTEPVALTTIYDTIKVYVHSSHADDDVTTVTATLMDIHSFADNVHTWHVAKTGNDSNPGHSFDEAYLTIMAAEAAAANGDTIIIYPGSYVENVDLDTNNKALILRGTNRTKCIIAPATGDGVVVGDYNTLENLTINALEVLTGVGVDSGAATNELNIINCTIRGGHTGLRIEGGTEGSTIKDSSIEGSLYAAKPQARDMVFVNCRFESTVDTAAVGTEIAVLLEPNNTIFKNCFFRCSRTTNSVTATTYGLKAVAGVYEQVFADCVFKIRVMGVDCSGDAVSIYLPDTNPKVTIADSVVLTSNTGSGAVLDFSVPAGGHLSVGDTFYATSSGPIMGLEKETLENMNSEMDKH